MWRLHIKYPGLLVILYVVGAAVSYVWYTVAYPFILTGMPAGWDTGAYLAWAHVFLTKGLPYVQQPTFIQFSGLNLAPLLLLSAIIRMVGNELSAYIFFQIIIISLYFLSAIFLLRKISSSLSYLMLSFFFLVSGYDLARTALDLYANLFVLAFLQFALGSLISLRSKWSRSMALIGFVSTLMLFYADIEIGGFGVAVIVVAFLIMETENLSKNLILDLRNTFSPFLIAFLIGTASWLPYLKDYLPISAAFNHPPNSNSVAAVVAGFGGVWLIPLWVTGFGFIIFSWKSKREFGRGLKVIAGWAIVELAFLIFAIFWDTSITYRIALISPYYLVFGLNGFLLWEAYNAIGTNLLRKILVAFVIAIIIGSVAAVSIQTGAQQSTKNYNGNIFFTQSQYSTLSSIAKYFVENHIDSSKTLFLIYPSTSGRANAISAWVNLYDNWIYGVVGSHYSYYGTFQNLTQGVPLDLVSPNAISTYQYYSSLLQSSIKSNLSLTIVIVDFLYSNSINTLQFQQPLPGVFLKEIVLNGSTA